MFATLGSALSLNSQFVPISEQRPVYCPTFLADAKTHSEVRGLASSAGAVRIAASSGRTLLVSEILRYRKTHRVDGTVCN